MVEQKGGAHSTFYHRLVFANIDLFVPLSKSSHNIVTGHTILMKSLPKIQSVWIILNC